MPLGAAFRHLGATDMWGQILLCGGGRPVRSGMFSSAPGLYPLDARSTPTPDSARCPLGENRLGMRTAVWMSLSRVWRGGQDGWGRGRGSVLTPMKGMNF